MAGGSRQRQKRRGVDLGSLSLLLPVNFTSSFSFCFDLDPLADHALFFLCFHLTEAAEEISRESLSSRSTMAERERWSERRRERGLRTAPISQLPSLSVPSRVHSRADICFSRDGALRVRRRMLHRKGRSCLTSERSSNVTSHLHLLFPPSDLLPFLQHHLFLSVNLRAAC